MKDNDMIFGEFDRDLKKSLDAAFDMNDISVSEELIASTLSKINLIKDKTGETGNAEDESNEINAANPTDIKDNENKVINITGREETDNKENDITETGTAQIDKKEIVNKETGTAQTDKKEIVNQETGKDATEHTAREEAGMTKTDPAEDDDKRRNVTDISGKAGFRRFARIAGPIAAAVIIGLFGIALVRNNLIFSSKSDNSAPANYAANSAVSMKAADTDEDYSSGKAESESVSEMAGSDQAAYEPAASDDYAVYYGNPEISSFNGDFGENMNTVKSTEEIDCQELCDDNKIDEGSADGSTKESKAEASDAGTGGTDYGRAGATPTDDIEEDVATEDEYREYCFAIPGDLAEEIAGIADRYAFGRIDASEYQTGELDIQNLKEKLQEADLQKNDDLSPDEDGSLQGEEDMSAVTAGYLVIRDGIFYFTDNESLEPEEGSSIYILETPGSSDDAMATEIEAIMK